MRVGIILGSGDQSGGGLQHEISVIENLKEYGSDCGHEFYVFSYKYLFDVEKLKCEHIKFVRVDKGPFISRLVRYLSFKIKKNLRINSKQSYKTPINKAIEKNNIELMYYPAPYWYSSTIDLPYILTVWDLQHRLQPEFPEVSSKGKWRNRENFFREAIGKAFVIIVDEEAGKEDVIQFYNVREEKVFVLPFVPPKINRVSKVGLKSIQDKYKIPQDYLFYPAQFWPHKNHVAILKAINIIKEEHNIDIPAVFTGSDKVNLSYIKKLTYELGLKKQVFFLGYVPDEDIPPLYKAALALVMPTYFGPSNLPVYEAFSYQCPVITSDIRGIREQVGDAGILVDPRKFKALSEAILKLYKDRSLRESLVINGTKKIKSWTGKDYIENFIKIIGSFSSKRLCWDKYASR